MTIDTLVEVGGLSNNYMRKVFKDIVGQSMTVYLTEYRFAKAKELLIQTDFPANRIGEMVRFENSNYFYVSFKKHCGKTPIISENIRNSALWKTAKAAFNEDSDFYSFDSMPSLFVRGYHGVPGRAKADRQGILNAVSFSQENRPIYAVSVPFNQISETSHPGFDGK